jgi:hypothetical protein
MCKELIGFCFIIFYYFSLYNIYSISLLFDVINCNVAMSILVEEQIEKEDGVPVCGANLSSPVVDKAYYIDQIHFIIGNRMYIENADE